jgi:hypothetical protein
MDGRQIVAWVITRATTEAHAVSRDPAVRFSERRLGGQLSNHRINLTVGPVTGLARSARPAPSPPAGYAER